MDDHKIHARLRREAQLRAMQDGLDLRTRVVPAQKKYLRAPKHRPQTAEEWERIELWP